MTTPDQPGWYDDPQDSNAQRYWDGQSWTPHRQRKIASRPAPPPPVADASPPTLRNLPPPTLPHLPPPADIPASEEKTGILGPPPPPPDPQTQGSGAQMASDGLETVRGFAARLSITEWVLLGGLVLAVVATFFPFVTLNVGGLLGTAFGWGGAQFGVLALVAGAVALAWPILLGSPMIVGRLIGLSVVVVLLVVLAVVWFTRVSDTNSEAAGIVNVSPGWGLLLYGLAVVAIAVAVIRLWIDQSRTQKQTY